MGNRMFQMAALYAFSKKYNDGDIYFTDEKWFSEYEGEIQNLYGDGIKNTEPINKVAIHIRRGDFKRYPQNSFHTSISETDYYEKAIKHFPDDKFLVFYKDRNGEESDREDKEWCIDYFNRILPDRFELAETDSGIDDMNLMARCKHQIIANSSFSWWAAYLNPNPSKIVISPSEESMCRDGIVRIKVPKKWIQIKPN